MGVQGYDLVSYRNGKKPIPGNGNLLSTHKGVTYLFANQANKEAFDESAEKFVPAYGGYCAFGVSVKKKFIGDPTVWKVVNDRLYLNLDTGIQEMWLADVPGKIAQADNNWEAIENKSPSDLWLKLSDHTYVARCFRCWQNRRHLGSGGFKNKA